MLRIESLEDRRLLSANKGFMPAPSTIAAGGDAMVADCTAVVTPAALPPEVVVEPPTAVVKMPESQIPDGTFRRVERPFPIYSITVDPSTPLQGATATEATVASASCAVPSVEAPVPTAIGAPASVAALLARFQDANTVGPMPFVSANLIDAPLTPNSYSLVARQPLVPTAGASSPTVLGTENGDAATRPEDSSAQVGPIDNRGSVVAAVAHRIRPSGLNSVSQRTGSAVESGDNANKVDSLPISPVECAAVRDVAFAGLMNRPNKPKSLRR